MRNALLGFAMPAGAKASRAAIQIDVGGAAGDLGPKAHGCGSRGGD